MSSSEVATPRYSLRPATESDYEFLRNLHHSTLREYIESTWGWDQAFQDQRFRERFDPGKRQIIVVGGEDVGVLTLERQPDAFYVGLILIAPHHQGHGLGTAVLTQIMATAAHDNLPVRLHVLKTNTRARRLYERTGFAISGDDEVRWQMSSASPRPDDLKGDC